jgi:hypothetical protein
MGLSIWMPERDDEFHERIQDYAQSALYQAGGQKTGWKNFMMRMYPKP